MNRAWRWFAPGYLATLPFALVAIGYALVIGGHSWRWQDGCLTFISPDMIGNPGGQCWSPVIGFADETQRARADLQTHERTHVVQAMCIQSLAPLLVWTWTLVDMPWGWAWWQVLASVGDVLWFAIAVAPFAFAYLVAFLRYWLTTQKDERPGWHDDYLRNPFEAYAYRVQDRYLAMRPSEQTQVWGHR